MMKQKISVAGEDACLSNQAERHVDKWCLVQLHVRKHPLILIVFKKQE